MCMILVDEHLEVNGADVRLVLLERENGKILLHLRTASVGDTARVASFPPRVSDGVGRQLQWLSTASGGTGTEQHVTHVYERSESSELSGIEVQVGDTGRRIHIAQVHQAKNRQNGVSG